MKYDFRILLDEKEEVIVDRDAYKCKVHRLNHELTVALKGESSHAKVTAERQFFLCVQIFRNRPLMIRIFAKLSIFQVLDIDSLILENSLLQERLINADSELNLSQQSCAKYKVIY